MAFSTRCDSSVLDRERALEIVDALLDDDTVNFRRRQFDLLRNYRRREANQEPLSIALLSHLETRPQGKRRLRLEETWDLLEHVHDPFIG